MLCYNVISITIYITLRYNVISILRPQAISITFPWSEFHNQDCTSTKGHSDCIISMCIQRNHHQNTTSFSMYARTPQVDSAKKYLQTWVAFYKRFPQMTKSSSLVTSMLECPETLKPGKACLEKNGMGSCSDNRHLLLDFCTEQQLTIPNTIFQQKDSLNITWTQLQSTHWQQKEYILVHQHGLKDAFHTRVLPIAECHIDHCIVCFNLSFHVKPQPSKDVAPKMKIKVHSLWSTKVQVPAV